MHNFSQKREIFFLEKKFVEYNDPFCFSFYYQMNLSDKSPLNLPLNARNSPPHIKRILYQLGLLEASELRSLNIKAPPFSVLSLYVTLCNFAGLKNKQKKKKKKGRNRLIRIPVMSGASAILYFTQVHFFPSKYFRRYCVTPVLSREIKLPIWRKERRWVG